MKMDEAVDSVYTEDSKLYFSIIADKEVSVSPREFLKLFFTSEETLKLLFNVRRYSINHKVLNNGR